MKKVIAFIICALTVSFISAQGLTEYFAPN